MAKLTISQPIDKNGWHLFNSQFAKLQSELVLLEIRKLNVSYELKEKLLFELIEKLKERLVD